jgi:hypothetical protein
MFSWLGVGANVCHRRTLVCGFVVLWVWCLLVFGSHPDQCVICCSWCGMVLVAMCSTHALREENIDSPSALRCHIANVCQTLNFAGEGLEGGRERVQRQPVDAADQESRHLGCAAAVPSVRTPFECVQPAC